MHAPYVTRAGRRCSCFFRPYGPSSRRSLRRAKPQSNVIGDPRPRLVPQLWLELAPDFMEIGRARFQGQRNSEALSKSLQPRDNIAGERRGPREESDRVDAESGAFEAGGVLAGLRKVPRDPRFPVEPASVQSRDQGTPNYV